MAEAAANPAEKLALNADANGQTANGIGTGVTLNFDGALKRKRPAYLGNGG